MSSVDLLLHRPWSDSSKRSEEGPVDFSSRGRVESEVDIGFTDIDSTQSRPKATGNNSFHAYVSAQGTNLSSGGSDRDHCASSPDSGFSSPSDGTAALSYHHLLPGLYQQALANQAMQREVFYRDAIQRELISRQQFSQRQQFVEQKLFPNNNLGEHEQIAPLSLVVKKDATACESDREDDGQISVGESSPLNEVKETETQEYTSKEISSSSTISVEDHSKSEENTEAGKSSEFVAPPPQTSPYHLFPPALYWPHGSTPLGNHIPKPITHPFSTVPPLDHPLHKSLPSPVNSNTLLDPGNMFSTNNPLMSPLGQHLSDSIASPLASQSRQQLNSQLTSPLTSPVARAAYDLSAAMSNAGNPFGNFNNAPNTCQLSPRGNTPIKPEAKSPGGSVSLKRKLSVTTFSPDKKSKSPKKNKASRRLNFDEDKSSPVSGTIIRELGEGEEPLVVRKGDIDPAYNVVEITEEAKAEIAKIENKIGDYVCRLCKELYDDAFGLAQHRCSRIIHVEYRCPECDKVFNCPANLASHRRWHKPKGNLPSTSKSSEDSSKPSTSGHFTIPKIGDDKSQPSTSKASFEEEYPAEDENTEGKETELYDCTICFKSFKRQAYLRKHLLTHRRDTEETTNNVLQPIPHKLPFQHQITESITPAHVAGPIPTPGQTHVPTGHMVSPLSPPMLSPPFSPSEVYKCHVCQSNFFSPTALTIHFATTHRRDPRSDSAFSSGNEFVDMALNNLASTSSNFCPTIQVPRPHFATNQPPSFTAQLLHRPSQVSATS